MFADYITGIVFQSSAIEVGEVGGATVLVGRREKTVNSVVSQEKTAQDITAHEHLDTLGCQVRRNHWDS